MFLIKEIVIEILIKKLHSIVGVFGTESTEMYFLTEQLNK